MSPTAADMPDLSSDGANAARATARAYLRALTDAHDALAEATLALVTTEPDRATVRACIRGELVDTRFLPPHVAQLAYIAARTGPNATTNRQSSVAQEIRDRLDYADQAPSSA